MIINKDIEEAVAPEKLEQTEIHSPADVAASFFSMQGPRLKNLLENMSAKQIRRFVMHVAEYPLNKTHTIMTDAEKRAAYLFNEMVFNKCIMQLTAEVQKVDEATKAQQDNQQELANGQET